VATPTHLKRVSGAAGEQLEGWGDCVREREGAASRQQIELIITSPNSESTRQPSSPLFSANKEPGEKRAERRENVNKQLGSMQQHETRPQYGQVAHQ